MANLHIQSDAKEALSALEKLERLTKSLTAQNASLARAAGDAAGGYRDAGREAKVLLTAQQAITAEAKASAAAVDGFTRATVLAGAASKSLAGSYAEISRSASAAARSTLTLSTQARRALIAPDSDPLLGAARNTTAIPEETLARIRASRAEEARGRARADAKQFTRLNEPSAIFAREAAERRKALDENLAAAGRIGSKLKEVGLGFGESLKDGLERGAAKGVSILTTLLTGAVRTVASTAETVLVTAFAASAAALANSIRLAVKEQPIAEGFGALANSRGLGDQEEALNRLRVAAKGTVSDLQLMQNANAALFLGAAQNADQLDFLTEAGRRLGKVMGRDASEGFQDLALGIGRQSRLILDNLGLIVRVEEAQNAYADSVGATVDELSENEKKLAFVDAAYASILAKLAELGPEQELANDTIGQLTASLSNLSVEVGKTFIPQITEVTRAWADFVKTLSPAEIRSAIDAGVQAVTGGAGSILDFLLGAKSGARTALSNLGSDFVNALTNPSKTAFEVLSIRFGSFIDVARSGFTEIWDLFKSYVDQIIGFYLPYKLGAAFGPLGALIGGGAGLLVGAAEQVNRGTERDAIRSTGERTREAANVRADMAIADLLDQARQQTDRQGGILDTQRQLLEATEKGNASTGANDPLRDAANADRLSRETEKANLAELERLQKEEVAWAERAWESQKAEAELRLKALDAAKDALDEEERQRERVLNSLTDGAQNLKAAIDGLPDPTKQVGAYLDDFAREIRRYPDIFHDIAEDIRNIDLEIVAAQEELSRNLDRASARFRDDIDRRSKSFLQEDPQDGETVAVRAAKRRAQRARRRFNQATINDAFRAPSFEQFGIPQGFGAQNVERLGGDLNKSFPLLQQALLKIVDEEGRTLLQNFEEQQTEIITATAEQVQQLNLARAEAVAKQNAANEALKALVETSVGFERDAAKVTETLVRELEGVKKKQSEANAVLESVKRFLGRGR